MPIYTVTLTDAEDYAMRHFMVNVQDWINISVHGRAQAATEEIVKYEVEQRIKPGAPPIPPTIDEIVMSTTYPMPVLPPEGPLV